MTRCRVIDPEHLNEEQTEELLELLDRCAAENADIDFRFGREDFGPPCECQRQKRVEVRQLTMQDIAEQRLAALIIAICVLLVVAAELVR